MPTHKKLEFFAAAPSSSFRVFRFDVSFRFDQALHESVDVGTVDHVAAILPLAESLEDRSLSPK